MLLARCRLAAILVGAAAAAAACGSNDDPTLEVPATPSSSSTVAPADGADGPPDASFQTTPVSVAPGAPTYLTAVRAARHPGFDRVVFEFRSGLPGYRVQYVAGPVVEDGSGEEVGVEGGALLEVHMEAASGVDLSGGQARQTYTGPRRIDPATAVLTEIVRVTDFEANLDWVIGVRELRPFRVFTLADPARLVVDVSASAGG
jgi:hypothetical protein